MPLEIELKLEVDAGEADALVRDPLFTADPIAAETQCTSYFDTPERSIEAAGYRLRVREVGGQFIQTIKPTSVAAGLFGREEWEYFIGSPKPDRDALGADDLVALGRSGALDRLETVSRCEVRRRSWLFHHGANQIQIDLDEGKVKAGRRRTPFVELELELRSGNPAGLVALAIELAQRTPVRLGVLTKAERGTALADGTLGSVVKTAPVPVGPGMSVADSFRAIVQGCIRQYALNEPLVVAGRDPAALHQCRVAVRRLRSAISLFRPAITDDQLEPMRQELRAFGAGLGDARNLDVYLERELPDDERARLCREREFAYDRAIAAMRSAALRTLLIRLVGWSALGEWRSREKALAPVEGFAAKRLDRLWRSIRLDGADLAELSEEERHQLRIQIKKLRYAVEFLREAFPISKKRRKRFGDAVEALQEQLGQLNDMATAAMLVPKAEPGWLIRPHDEREHLSQARRAYGELQSVGPLWRKAGKPREDRSAELVA